MIMITGTMLLAGFEPTEPKLAQLLEKLEDSQLESQAFIITV